MKIILASDLSFLLKYGYDLTGISKENMKIGYITTAGTVARSPFLENVKSTIRKEGYYFEEFDIEGKTHDQMRDFFKDKNVIHVEGGNTFYLLKAVRESGFADVLKEELNLGKVYIGTSAGAYIMCPTIEVSSWNENGVERSGVSDFAALHYAPFVLKVHYKDEMSEKIKEKIPALKYPLRILRDGQGIFFEDGKATFVGDGEEVFLS